MGKIGIKKILIVIVIVSLMGTTLVGCSKESSTLEKVTVVLDWTPNTNHTGIYVAKALGYFKDNGLNVEIIQPSEGTAEQIVASGSGDFGISYQENVTLARSEGVPIVSIGAIIQHNTSGFISRKEENILKISDFENKKYGGWGSEIESETIKYLMDMVGADFNKTQIVTTGDIDFFTGTETNNIDYAWVFEGWTLQQAKLEGIDVHYIDIGKIAKVFDYYTPVIITNEKHIQNDDITIKFMNAVKKGYQYAINNPDKAADLLLQEVPELNKELVIQSQRFLASKYQDDASYWGEQKSIVWQRYMDWLVECGFMDNKINIQDAFTNKYTR